MSQDEESTLTSESGYGPPQDSQFSTQLENIYLTEARVYIAGILVPTTRVSINSVFNQPPSAEIAMPAYSELMYLGDMDRVPVHIFVRETMVENANFLLLFEGYVTDTSYVNSASQRSIMVTAISILDILEDVRLRFLSQLENYLEPALPGNKDLAMHAQANALTFPLYLLQYGLVPADDKEEHTPCCFPSDYLENIYAFIQKSSPPEEQEQREDTQELPAPLGPLHASALTAYYGKYTRDIFLLNRFERLPYFDKPGSDNTFAWNSGEVKATEEVEGEKTATIFPMMYGMRQSEALGLLTHSITSIAQKLTAMELLAFLVEQMEYEYLFITNPAYHQEKPPKKEEAESGEQLKNSNEPGAEQKNAEQQEQDQAKKKEKLDRLVCSCLKPLLNDSLPPGCNVIYRSMVNNLSATIRHKGIPTRVRVYDQYGALAKLTMTTEPSPLNQFGLITYYPSKEFKKFDQEETTPPYLNYLASELLEVEEFTGPWVRELNSPPWFFYLQNSNLGGVSELTIDGVPVPTAQAFKERFLRRQLLNSKYLMRQMEVMEIFDPYITPGFPGVVFDSGDSGFAYAGHVLSVTHNISAQEVSTTVGFNFVRPLNEAAQIEIPNPLVMVQQLTHDPKKLSEVYAAILGTPVSPPKIVGAILGTPEGDYPGAKALAFSELEEMSDCGPDATEPNNNPREAYQAKRRNIATFEQYLDFMGFSATTGDGPEGPKTPLELKGDFLEKRRGLDIYQGTTWDAHIPNTEKIIEEALRTAGKLTKKEGEAEPAKQEGAEPAKSEGAGAEQQPAAKAEEKKQVKRTLTKVDVRDLLKKIAEREFSRVVYK